MKTIITYKIILPEKVEKMVEEKYPGSKIIFAQTVQVHCDIYIVAVRKNIYIHFLSICGDDIYILQEAELTDLKS